MQQQELIDSDFLSEPAKRTGKMAVDEYRMSIDAITGEIGNVVFAIDNPNTAADGMDGIDKDFVLDVSSDR